MANNETPNTADTTPSDLEDGQALGGQELAPVDPEDEVTPTVDPEDEVTPTVDPEENVLRKFIRTGPAYDVALLDRAVEDGGRADLRPKVRLLNQLVGELSDDKRRTRIASVKDEFESRRVLRTDTLDAVVTDNPEDTDTKRVRNKLRQLIKSLPEK